MRPGQRCDGRSTRSAAAAARMAASFPRQLALSFCFDVDYDGDARTLDGGSARGDPPRRGRGLGRRTIGASTSRRSRVGHARPRLVHRDRQLDLPCWEASHDHLRGFLRGGSTAAKRCWSLPAQHRDHRLRDRNHGLLAYPCARRAAARRSSAMLRRYAADRQREPRRGGLSRRSRTRMAAKMPAMQPRRRLLVGTSGEAALAAAGHGRASGPSTRGSWLSRCRDRRTTFLLGRDRGAGGFEACGDGLIAS